MIKRAMSPLFSTIILIGFAMALGGVVMSWGKEGYTIEKPVGACKQASLALISYGPNRGICTKENRLYFNIQNNGEIDLDGIKISILGDEGVDTALINKKLMVADISKLDAEYSGVGKIEKVIFTPQFTVLGQEKLCPKNGFSAERIGECQ